MWQDTDAFYQSLTPEDQAKFDSGKRGEFGRVYAGAINTCPTCKEQRITDCIACGCGHCFTCGYRFSCVSLDYSTKLEGRTYYYWDSNSNSLTSNLSGGTIVASGAPSSSWITSGFNALGGKKITIESF